MYRVLGWNWWVSIECGGGYRCLKEGMSVAIKRDEIGKDANRNFTKHPCSDDCGWYLVCGVVSHKLGAQLWLVY